MAIIKAFSSIPKDVREWAVFFRGATVTVNGNENVEEAINSKAPKNAQFLVGASNPQLTGQRVVTDTSTIRWDLATAGQAKASLVYVQTAAELAASVTPVNYEYEPGYIRRYGTNTTPGTTDMTTALLNAIKVSDADGRIGVVLDAETYLTDVVAIASGGNVPVYIDGRGATLKSRTSATSSYLLSIENPHGEREHFEVRNLTLDCDSKTRGLKVHGMQRGVLRNIRVINSTQHGFEFAGESGFGIYYSLFEGLHAGANGGQNDGHGFVESGGAGPSFFMAANTFLNCRAQFNKGDGWSIDYASNTHAGCESEKNDTYGWNFDNTVSVDVIGGYAENNHQNWATDGVSDATPDNNFNATANTTCVRIVGGRHIGTPAGTWSGQGNWYMPGYVGVIGMPSLDPVNGQLSVVSLRTYSGGGIGLNASPIDSTLNVGAPGFLAQSGVNCVGWDSTINDTETGLLVRRNVGGTLSFQRVSMGAADSGGAGFKLLRVPN